MATLVMCGALALPKQLVGKPHAVRQYTHSPIWIARHAAGLVLERGLLPKQLVGKPHAVRQYTHSPIWIARHAAGLVLERGLTALLRLTARRLHTARLPSQCSASHNRRAIGGSRGRFSPITAMNKLRIVILGFGTL
jgi:hypothetical protein